MASQCLSLATFSTNIANICSSKCMRGFSLLYRTKRFIIIGILNVICSLDPYHCIFDILLAIAYRDSDACNVSSAPKQFNFE